MRRAETAGACAPAPDADVLVIGAGPVGLLLAAELAARGRRVFIAEQRAAPSRASMAIGITPPSLAILERLGLADRFLARGVQVVRAGVAEGGRFLGVLEFSGLPSAHRFVLSIPQADTVKLLRDHLRDLPAVRLLDAATFESCAPAGGAVRAWLRDARSGARFAVTAGCLVGCDGARSAVRRAAGIACRQRHYRARFVMGDFPDTTGWGDEARLFFSAQGSVESFPLPDHWRRWIVSAAGGAAEATLATHVADRVGRLTGRVLAPGDCRDASVFQPCWALARHYARGRVVLCGDAAHQMSPIGGQGMNTGFADAAMLAPVLDAGLEDPQSLARGLRDYTRVRRLAFRIAARRAARGMWLGTRTGTLASCGRRLLIAHVLLHPAVQARLAPAFAMLSLPGVPQAAGTPALHARSA